ncbi:MAG: outer membrane beta-barrel protein [Bacteroidales bacterium]|nr:outer membrane beta-barrel protein [Candidatus Scybalocola fimicaballi]
MKKLILAVLTLLLTTIVCAQPYTMIKGGAQLSKFSSDGSESKFGVRGGLGGFVPLGESSFYFMPQLVYAQKGQEDGKFLGNTTLHYAEVPLTIGALVKFTRNVGLGLMVGPYAGVAVAGKCDNPEVSDLFSTISRVDAGISGSVQLHIWKIFVFADYDWGLRSIMKDTDYEIGEKLTTRSGAVGIGFTY